MVISFGDVTKATAAIDIKIEYTFWDGQTEKLLQYENAGLVLMIAELRRLHEACETWIRSPLETMDDNRPLGTYDLCQENFHSLRLSLANDVLNRGKVHLEYNINTNHFDFSGSMSVDQTCVAAFTADIKTIFQTP